jgi:5-methylcytosine-specific restriction endonuclease McrA
MSQRTLRSRRLRLALWYAADGHCQRCGRELNPANWHADHIVAYVRTRRTNVHEMQALCPQCNLAKGQR